MTHGESRMSSDGCAASVFAEVSRSQRYVVASRECFSGRGVRSVVVLIRTAETPECTCYVAEAAAGTVVFAVRECCLATDCHIHLRGTVEDSDHSQTTFFARCAVAGGCRQKEDTHFVAGEKECLDAWEVAVEEHLIEQAGNRRPAGSWSGAKDCQRMRQIW